MTKNSKVIKDRRRRGRWMGGEINNKTVIEIICQGKYFHGKHLLWNGFENIVLELICFVCPSELLKSGRFECGLGWWQSFWAVREVVEMCLCECWVAIAITFLWGGGRAVDTNMQENMSNNNENKNLDYQGKGKERKMKGVRKNNTVNEITCQGTSFHGRFWCWKWFEKIELELICCVPIWIM